MIRDILGGETFKFITGDAGEVLNGFPDRCVDCCITSPPYWGMRVYDSGGIGNEDSFDEYASSLMSVFSQVKRVLKDDGSFWLNMGDRYYRKNLVGMPWRMAIALMDDGWILRNDVIWHKRKGTQSCKDRLRDNHEHLFHFVKSRKYHYDADSIRISPSALPSERGGNVVSATGVTGAKYRNMIEHSQSLTDTERENALLALDTALSDVKEGLINDFRMTIRGGQRPWHGNDEKLSGRAKELSDKGFYVIRVGSNGHLPDDVWDIVPEDTWRKDSHCAVYPEELLTVPIKATCRQGGIVMDPFSGTGTTVAAAVNLGRRGVGIDLSYEYNVCANWRLSEKNRKI
ncbi:MAG: site-specific DNA-methyltransferase [Paludibacteraceae bacterium]|nr:site-specific DNA-methyltransferase [Paludibacteraceae bacterium]